MAEYIEKQAAIKFIDNCLLHEDKLQGVEKETLLAVKKQIEAIPTADVRPVVRGKWVWIHRRRGGFRRVTGEDDFGVRHTITVDERYEIDDPYCPFCGKLNESVFLNYCPNCSADMREDTYNRDDLNGYTAEEMKEAGEAAVKGFLDGLSFAKRLNKLEEYPGGASAPPSCGSDMRGGDAG